MGLPFEEGHLLTNPVWSIEQMLKLLDFDRAWDNSAERLANVIQSMVLAGAAIPDWWIDYLVSRRYLPRGRVPAGAKSRARVVGLCVDRRGPHGFVVPLEARYSSSWRCSPFLPFTEFDVQDALHRLLIASGLTLAGPVPERWSFHVSEKFGERIHGGSMTVAAVLAVLDAMCEQRSPLFEQACAVIETDGEEAFRATEFVELKLAAFVREFRTGGLLVRHSDCRKGCEFDRYFDQVWTVRNHADLVTELDRARLLAPLFRDLPLTRNELRRVRDRLNHLEHVAHRYSDALELAHRLNSASVSRALPEWHRREPLEILGNLQRHLGRFPEAISTSRQVLQELERAGEAASYDEVAEATVCHAAALFDGHRFPEMKELLLPWAARIRQDPCLLHPTTRIALQNTLGRAKAVLSDSGWEVPFQQSIALQEQYDMPGLARTWNYMLLAMLRHGRLGEVRSKLNSGIPLMEEDEFSRWILSYIRAELARREGCVWHEPGMETSEQPLGTPGHPWGFYFQATARQPGCTDAEARFRRSAECFTGRVADQFTILHFYAACMRLSAAAAAGQSSEWQTAREEVVTFVARPESEGLKHFYGHVLQQIDARPSMESAEQLLTMLPFL